jgi:hypothetical protein
LKLYFVACANAAHEHMNASNTNAVNLFFIVSSCSYVVDE